MIRGWPTITGVTNFRYKTITSITTTTITAIIIIAIIITIIQCIKAFIMGIITQIIVINTASIIIALVVANITIIDIIITTTTNHCFRGLLDFTLRGYQDTASTQRNSRNLPLPLTNDERRCLQNPWCSCQQVGWYGLVVIER